MINQRAELPIVKFSVKVYQALLVAYPNKFEQEYGAEMAQVFRDSCLRAVHQNGIEGMVKLWTVTLFDLIQSVISEHAQKEIEMKKEMKSEDIRRAGGALIWGAATFVISLFLLLIGDTTRDTALRDTCWGLSGLLMALPSPALLVMGLLGVRNRYGDKVGWFGKNILLLGIILGPLTSLIGFLGATGDVGWHLIYIAPGILFTSLALFGLVALYKNPLPRWNVVPVIAGLWYPIVVLAHIIIGVRVGNWLHGGPMYYMAPYLDVIQGIALVALGYILKSDVPEETVAPA